MDNEERDARFIAACREAKSSKEARTLLGIKDDRAFRRRRKRIEERLGVELPRWGVNPHSSGQENIDAALSEDSDVSRETRLLIRNQELQAEVAQLRSMAADAADLKRLIHGCLERDPEPPQWLYKKPRGKNMHHGIPTLFLSDLHWDEQVYPAQINGVNEYSREIATQRLKHVVDTTIYLSHEVLSPSPYEGIVLALGGDMFSGYIHEELRENKSGPLYDGLVHLTDQLHATIDLLAERFGRVFVPCVVGNHGRIDRKPRAKFFVHDNVDWLLYRLLMRDFNGRKDVAFLVPESSDAYYRVHNTRYMLTHGNQFRGGTGIAGPATPWALGDHKKRKRQDAIKQPYDTLIFGHFHTLAWGINNAYVCNGSLKGYDEYAYSNNYPYEPPKQALWFTHPEYGITHQMAVYADKPQSFDERPWVSVMDQD